MSDGGAQALVEVGKLAVSMAQFKVGRVVLWFIAAWLALCAVTAQANGALLFGVAVALALLALGATFLVERRKRQERASLRTALVVLAVVALSLVGGLALLLRGKKAPLPEPPTEAEVDALAQGDDA